MPVRGVPYPLRRTARGLLPSAEDIPAIKADMLAVVLTSPGERVMEPLFGTPLRRLNYDNAQAPMEARRLIALALKRWEPRVQVTDITVHARQEQEFHILSITISFLHPMRQQEKQIISVELPVKRLEIKEFYG